MRRPAPQVPCADARGAHDPGSATSAPRSDQAALDVAMALLGCLVDDHGAVVTEADFRSDGSGSYTVRIPTSLRQPDEG